MSSAETSSSPPTAPPTAAAIVVVEPEVRETAIAVDNQNSTETCEKYCHNERGNKQEEEEEEEEEEEGEKGMEDKCESPLGVIGPLGAAVGISSVTSTNTALVVFLMERPKSLASRTRNSPLSMDRCNFFITSTGFKMHVTLTVISRLTGDIAPSDDVSMEVNTLLVSVSALAFTDGLLLRVSSLMVEVACMSRTEEMA